MPVIYLDGPEKAGKSTIAWTILRKYGGRIRAWGPVKPDDRVYAEPLLDDISSTELIVWDRAWVAEHVYAALLGRDRRLADDPWLGEWLYGRALRTAGYHCIILGPNIATLRTLRDGTDLPVDPADERRTYQAYGKQQHVQCYVNQHTVEGAELVADAAVDAATGAYNLAKRMWLLPPVYAGPTLAPVVFVGEGPGGSASMPGSGLPFTSRLTTMLGRDLGEFANRCGWCNASDVPAQSLRGRRLIVACGKAAEKWVRYNVDPKRMITVDHPAFAYRWGRAQERLPAYREVLDAIRKEFQHGEETG